VGARRKQTVTLLGTFQGGRRRGSEAGSVEGDRHPPSDRVDLGPVDPLDLLERAAHPPTQPAGEGLLDAADLDVTAAHTGLDVVEWLDDMDIEPGQIQAFRDRLDELTTDSDSLNEYATAAMHLHNLETETGLEAEGELGDLLADFEARSADEIERLEAAATALRDLEVDGDELMTAIERAVAIQELGFTLPVAEGVAKKLPTDKDDEEAVQSLIDAYREYESLENAAETLRSEKTKLSSDVEDLEEKIKQHQTHREKLDKAQNQLEETLDTQREALDELKEIRVEVNDQIAVDRSERSRLRSEIAECREELEKLETERDVVHAYRQLLREKTLPDSVLTDLDLFLTVRSHGPDSALWIAEPDARENVGTEIIRVAEEMIEGEEMIPVAEHERKAAALARVIPRLETAVFKDVRDARRRYA
jgi:exonuclease SbcC